MDQESSVHIQSQEQKVGNVSGKKKDVPFMSKVILFFAAMVFLGVLTGFFIARFTDFSPKTISSPTSSKNIQGKTVYGSADEKIFKDEAQGVLRAGGIDDEGSYHLERAGGASQNVYLTSSVLDLSLFVDKKVKVWGETHTAQKAGWLMDVGRLQVLE